MNATSSAREALAALSPYERENHKVLVIVAELLVEQNDLFREQLKQGGSAITVNNIAPAGTPTGAGRPAAGDKPAGKEAAVRLTEPDVPQVDDDDQDGDKTGRPAPAKKATQPAKKTTPAAGRRP